LASNFFEDFDLVLACGLGSIEGLIGVAKEFGRAVIYARDSADAYAGTDG